VHLRIPVALSDVGRAGLRDDGGKNGRALPNRLAHCAEVGVDSRKALPVQHESLQQMTKLKIVVYPGSEL